MYYKNILLSCCVHCVSLCFTVLLYVSVINVGKSVGCFGGGVLLLMQPTFICSVLSIVLNDFPTN